jgi:hypothetical protein
MILDLGGTALYKQVTENTIHRTTVQEEHSLDFLFENIKKIWFCFVEIKT